MEENKVADKPAPTKKKSLVDFDKYTDNEKKIEKKL